MDPLHIAEMHAEIRPYRFERWPRKRYVLSQSFQNKCISVDEDRF